MTVREKAGRRRFIAFHVEGREELYMGQVISAFNRETERRKLDRSRMRFRVIFFENPFVIVRCSHVFKDHVIDLINSMEFKGRKARTLKTSGTLKTLRVWFREKHDVVVPGKTRRKSGKPVTKSERQKN